MTSAMTYDVGIIACSKQKLAHAAPARELYVSQLFRMSLAYAERNCTSVHIVSAMHGLVELDDELTPYDFEMSDRGGKRYQDAWGDRVAAALVAKHGQTFTTLMLAGELYARPNSRRAVDDRRAWTGRMARAQALPRHRADEAHADRPASELALCATQNEGRDDMKKQRQELMTQDEFNERAAHELRRFTRRLKREAASNALQQQTTRLRQLWRIARSS